VGFGHPLSLRGYLRQRGVDVRALPEEQRFAEVAQLGQYLIREVGHVVPALAFPWYQPLRSIPTAEVPRIPDQIAASRKYLIFAMVGGVVGGLFSIGIRLELQEPGLQYFSNPQMFNVFTTAHGLIMVFFMIMPSLFRGFGNWFVPLMLGAPDMAFPRMNNISFLLLPPAFLLLFLSLFVDGASGSTGAGIGRTAYAPPCTSGHPVPAVDLAILVGHLLPQ
jgi:hypothetical protein